jgi:hypothetical protein
MVAPSVSTHTLKHDVTTTIVARTTTIISEHEDVFSEKDDHHHGHHHNSHHHHHGHDLSVVEGVKKTLKDYWFPTQSSDAGEDDTEDNEDKDPSLLSANSVMRRAHDYWKSLTQDSEEAAKELVLQAKEARDKASKEAKWAMFGFKREAREAYEEAEKKYRDALAVAEKAHEEALEKAKSSWFRQSDLTQKEVGEKVEDLTHKKWDQFKSAVDSLVFNPPKYSCSPSSQYWFSRQNPGIDSGWDCREIWVHPTHGDHTHKSVKNLPKKHLTIEKVHGVLESLFNQASLKAKNAPSSTSFESTLKSVKDYYHDLLDRISRNEQGAVEEFEALQDKVKAKLKEAKYYEEQVDSWLTSQWNAVIHNAGETMDQYERAFKDAVKSIRDARTEAYTTLQNNLHMAIDTAKDAINEAVKHSKQDKAKIQHAIQDASNSFANTLKEAEAKIKSVPKNAYDRAVEAFIKDTEQLKATLEQAAESARKSASSLSYEASKSVASVAARASESSEDLRKEARRKLNDVKSRASSEYGRATSSMSAILGAATPFAPLHKVHDSYQQLLGDAKHSLFAQSRPSALLGHHHLSSFYGALTMMYLLLLARKIWLHRNCCSAAKEAHGDLHFTKRGRRHSHTRSHSHDNRSSEDSDGHHHYYLRSQDRIEHKEPNVELRQQQHHRRHRHGEHKGHHHHHNSFSAVLQTFTSIVPMTMILLAFLELAGF